MTKLKDMQEEMDAITNLIIDSFTLHMSLEIDRMSSWRGYTRYSVDPANMRGLFYPVSIYMLSEKERRRKRYKRFIKNNYPRGGSK